MIKKIKATKLSIGMYIVGMSYFWAKHPFVENDFTIKNSNELYQIINSGIKEVEIDISKGLDIINTNFEASDREIQDRYKTIYNSETESTEYKECKTIYTEASQIIYEILESVKNREQIEISNVFIIIKKLKKLILKDHNRLLGLSRLRNIQRYTVEHSVSVAVILMAFGKNLEMADTIIEELGVGGILHDIGKGLIPESILYKKDKLNEAEFTIIRRHVFDSYSLLKKVKGISEVGLDVIFQHHERIDGEGYPKGLRGDKISIYGQMAAIADAYDAIASENIYHKSKEPTLVLKMLLKWSNQNFDSQLIQKFIKTVGIYPAGSVVLLNNDHLAKVLTIGEDILNPVVLIFLNVKSRSYVEPLKVDLSANKELKILNVESFEKWNLTH